MSGDELTRGQGWLLSFWKEALSLAQRWHPAASGAQHRRVMQFSWARTTQSTHSTSNASQGAKIGMSLPKLCHTSLIYTLSKRTRETRALRTHNRRRHNICTKFAITQHLNQVCNYASVPSLKLKMLDVRHHPSWIWYFPCSYECLHVL